jgi:hypothetical protein
MTIRIYNDRIQFSNFSLVVTPRGLSVNVSNTNVTANFVASNVSASATYFQGDDYGFAAGGSVTPPETYSNVIDKFPFAAHYNFFDIGDLTVSRKYGAGCSSRINGYVAGGTTGTRSNVIDKFSFTTNRNATDVGDLTAAKEGGAGVSSSTDGYVMGGLTVPGSSVTTIEKFSFASDYNATALTGGNTETPFNPPRALTSSRNYGAGISDWKFGHGYVAGGTTTPGSTLSTIERISFVNDGKYPIREQSSLISLPTGRVLGAGIASEDYGYFAGGISSVGGTTTQNVQRFPFAIYASAIELTGITTQARYGSAGVSSKFAGYVAGGYTFPTEVSVNTVDRFPFSSEFVPAGDIGDLTTSRGGGTGHQV